MVGEFYWRHSRAGKTLYGTWRQTGSSYWNGTTLEALTVANWGNYDVALTESEAGSYFYVGDVPPALPVSWYWLDVFEQAGGAPAISDEVVGGQLGYWDGTNFSPLASEGRNAGGDALPTAAEVKTTLGTGSSFTALASAANLAIVAGYLDTEIQSILGYVDCLPAVWVSVPTAAQVAAAVFDEQRGTHTGMLVEVYDNSVTTDATVNLVHGIVELLPSAAAISAQVAADLATAHGAGAWGGGGAIVITPISSLVSAGEVADDMITQYEHAPFGPFQIAIVDEDGTPIDLTGHNLQFLVYIVGHPETVAWSLTGADVTVGGAEGNQVTVSDDDTHTGTPGTYRYVLRDAADDRVWARGTLTIVAEASLG